MVVKKKKNRLLRAGAINTDSTDSPQDSVEPTTEAETPVAEPEQSGIGGRANRVRVKKNIKKQATPKKKAVASSSSDDDDTWEVLETDIAIINARQFLSKILAGLDEASVNRFWMQKKKLLVATVDLQNASVTKVAIEPTEFGQELAEILWDDIEGEGLDPHTIDVASDGWHYQFESGDSEEDGDE